jgi:hypothetical protein
MGNNLVNIYQNTVNFNSLNAIIVCILEFATFALCLIVNNERKNYISHLPRQFLFCQRQ